MYPYVVVVEETGLARNQFFADPDERQNVVECFVKENDVEYEVPSAFHDAQEWARNVKTTWVRTPEMAQHIAAYIAKHQPGRRVFWAHISGAAFAPPGEVTIQTVNEKGILPA